ncbi:MAG TPA: HD domain-containing protein [Cyclobacteriaceae bacterium]|nr:HD domain-containing protein [Cyclobacteriaceae bacterium]
MENFPVLNLIGTTADSMQKEAYVVGGFVRDYLLKRKKGIADIDIVASGSGIELAIEVAVKLGISNDLTIYRNFGTALIRNNGINIEFVGARKESYRHDSRKPEVEEGSIRDDQNRRDFTINALAICINAGRFGELIDPFNGRKDLESRIIRTPRDPQITFSDDPLRMMRAIRFASELDFDIEPDTFEAIKKNVDRIKIISQERISAELEKIILSNKPSYGFKLLFHSGLLAIVFPELAALQGVETVNKISHKDNFYHTLQVLDNVAMQSPDLWLRWAAILHDIAKPRTKRFDPLAGWTFHGHEDLGARMVPALFRRLKLPLDERMKRVQKLVRLHLRPIALVDEDVTYSAIRRLLFESGNDIDSLMMLCRADITSKNQDKVMRYLRNFEMVAKKIQEVEEKDRIRNFQPPVSGEEIMAYFGIGPSREVGVIKNQIKDAILEGSIHNDHSEAFEFMKVLGKKLGLNDKIESNINTLKR